MNRVIMVIRKVTKRSNGTAFASHCQGGGGW